MPPSGKPSQNSPAGSCQIIVCRVRLNLHTASPTGGRAVFIYRSLSPVVGEFLSDGAKIRSLFVIPDAAKRSFFYGVNFELGYEMPQFSPTPWALEIRPIIGVRNKEWEFIVNPIVDVSFGPGGEADFAPAVRLARNLGEDRFIGLEYYAFFGKIGDFLPPQQQYHDLYAVTDFKVNVVDVELGVGYGFTTGSDHLIFKAIIGYDFPVPGKRNDK